ncbi:alcohol dehydrogenase [Magnetospirillum sp. ME-1]|uniref:nucleotidyltransferase family protein n=1 Tax=Magnetospirillum sp. ME-1 TaxID=1639348 RepID=UPI000A179BF1|nr:nucleotidyltransferase family protein [Magnetospirillum sp. ME-1]ARJ66540.1 alcohol dehydrogenase [Magnetospirillum sp. ME-1]
MEGWKKTFIAPTSTVADVIRVIDSSGVQFCMVVDANDRLLGTVTDGDIRRGLLRNANLDAPVSAVMQTKPRTASVTETPENMRAQLEASLLNHLPIVDPHGRVVGLVLARELRTKQPEYPNPVVLMAGGLGNRLRPLTEETPKPLLRVGNKPLLETILERFIRNGFRNFFISVNYKAEMIKEHFGNGSRWGCRIDYLEEDRRLGTAGALTLLPEGLDVPLIVMNGDVLTKTNFASLLDFHAEQRADATICVREYDIQVPFGVVNAEGHRMTGIVEKPTHSFLVNAGIYVIGPKVLPLLTKGQGADMPDFLNRLSESGKEVAVFPLREYWIDIGRMDDLVRANGDFTTIFED